MRIYKPSYQGERGGRKESAVYWLDFYDRGRRRRVNLKTRDRKAADLKAAEIIKAVELGKAGVETYYETREATLSELVDEYANELRRRGRSGKYVHLTAMRAGALLAGARRMAEVTPERIRKALARLADRGASERTVNYYRTAAHGFFEWLIREGR